MQTTDGSLCYAASENTTLIYKQNDKFDCCSIQNRYENSFTSIFK